jgi:hypothetical protein
MPPRMTSFVTLTVCLATFFATFCLTMQASRAADDCLAKPNAPSPQGSHWYYRVDRATHRECWYLGAEGGKARTRERQAASHPQAPASKPISQQPISQRPIPQPNAQAAAEATTAQAAAADEITVGEARTAPDDATAALSMRQWSFPTPTASLRGSLSMSNSYAEEQPTTASEDDMPLIWPILTPAEFAASERPSQFAVTFAQLAAALAAVLGLAALIVRTIVRLSAARKPGRPNASVRWGSPARRDLVHRTVKATSDPALEMEASVRGLLHELQQRRDENQRRDFHRTRIDARMQPA